MDSMKFYKNGTFYKSAKPKDDTADNYFRPVIITGKWNFGSSGKVLRMDSATDCINVDMIQSLGKDNLFEYLFTLIDGYRINGTKRGKMCGNIDAPFLVYRYILSGIHWDKREIWQPKRQFKKAKKH